MGYFGSVRTALAVTMIVLITALVAADRIWIELTLALLLTGAGVAWFMAERRSSNDRFLRYQDATLSSFVRTLSHHRHDAMNDLQVLYGYVQLKKFDKLAQLVEKIKDKMLNESKLMKLGSPSLALQLLTFQNSGDSLRMEIVVREGLQLTGASRNEEHLPSIIQRCVQLYRLSAGQYGGEHCFLRLELSGNGEELLLDYHYFGDDNDVLFSGGFATLEEEYPFIKAEKISGNAEENAGDSFLYRVRVLLNT